ncbi:hypothetical protein [Saccharothrix violaceirubra]|uniref:Uncharacterized protein n=1 Tax=Saccharothrix violaceirubra TaxID=413306 RepID=A0A7W7T2P3_9PSEU|nr:hypothetical protein [Saccharothrix violaceirubra]
MGFDEQNGFPTTGLRADSVVIDRNVPDSRCMPFTAGWSWKIVSKPIFAAQILTADYQEVLVRSFVVGKKFRHAYK